MNVSDKYSSKKKILKYQFVKDIQLDDELLFMLAKANGVRIRSVQRWLASWDKRNGRILTTADNLAIIAKHFGISETADLLEEEYVEGSKYPERAQN